MRSILSKLAPDEFQAGKVFYTVHFTMRYNERMNKIYLVYCLCLCDMSTLRSKYLVLSERSSSSKMRRQEKTCSVYLYFIFVFFIIFEFFLFSLLKLTLRYLEYEYDITLWVPVSSLGYKY